MEEKELQQMFEAKRTAEANRRRQAELARLIEAQGAPKSRRMWPVWAGAAAASVALLLVTLPLLMRSEATEPVLVAQTEVPAVDEFPSTSDLQPPTSNLQPPTSAAPQGEPARMARTQPSAAEAPVVEEEAPAEEEVAPAPVETPAEIHVAEPKPAEAPKPRIHRRTSTRMVSMQGARRKEGGAASQLLAGMLGAEESEPLSLKEFELS